MKCLNCLEPEERQQYFIVCMSRLTPYNTETLKSSDNLSKEKLSLQGTLMLQTMLDFNKPIKIVNSMLSMDTNTLKNLFSNSMGSHIVDSFVKSLFVGEKSREKLVRKMTVKCDFTLPTLGVNVAAFSGNLPGPCLFKIWF